MKKINYWQVFAFTDKAGYGNPAGVVWDAGSLTDDEMQKIARINNLSETAFLFPTGNKDIPYRIRFFTPAKPISMCGHASVGSAYVFWKISGCPENMEYSQETDVGILGISIRKEDILPRIYLNMDNPPLTKKLDEHKSTIAGVLGIDGDSICSDLPVMLNEREYLYIPVKDLRTVQEMKPDFKAMLETDKKLGIHGWYVFSHETLDSSNDFHVRFFVPSYGVNEDPVTGTANAYFAEYYSQFLGGSSSCMLRMEQGYEINRNGIVEVNIVIEDARPVAVQIGGNAVPYIEGSIFI